MSHAFAAGLLLGMLMIVAIAILCGAVIAVHRGEHVPVDE